MSSKYRKIISPTMRGVFIGFGIVGLLIFAVYLILSGLAKLPRPSDANIEHVEGLLSLMQEKPNSIALEDLDNSFHQFFIDNPFCLNALQRELIIDGNEYHYVAGDSGKIKGIRKYFVDDSYLWVNFDSEVIIKLYFQNGNLVNCEEITLNK